MPPATYNIDLILAVLIALLLGTAAKTDSRSCNVTSEPDNLVSCPSPTYCLCDALHQRHADVGVVICLNYMEDAYLLFGYCLTYDNSAGTISLGKCPYNSYNNVSYEYPRAHVLLPQNISDLNDFMCGDLNREGLLCARCKEGYGPALYSFGLSCEKCKWYGWALYIVVEFLPITVFFIIVVAFRVKVTSPQMNVFVFFAQCVVTLLYLNSTLYSSLYYYSSNGSYILLQILLAFYGIWNLDFFRYIVPPFCVSSGFKNMHVLMFEFVSAVYPLTLILITYICIELHAHNYRLIVWLWKPFHRCFVKFRRSWDISTSMVDAFATFLLLSYSKLLFASLNLLCAVSISIVDTSSCVLYQHETSVLLYDTTIEYFSKEHIPFAVLSILIICVFVLFPLLLLVLYPTRIFRKCCRFSHHHSLHTFVEAFQGHYKDGTNGTRDYRSLSGLYLGLRIFFVLGIVFAYTDTNDSLAWMLVLFTFVIAILVISTVKPYKNDCANRLDGWLLILLVVLWMYAVVAHYFGGPGINTSSVLCIEVLLSIPMVVFALHITWKVTLKTRKGKSIAAKLGSLKSKVCGDHNPGCNQGELEAFPDRIVNPQLYESLEHSGHCNSHPLLVTTEEHATHTMASLAANPPNTYGSIN